MMVRLFVWICAVSLVTGFTIPTTGNQNTLANGNQNSMANGNQFQQQYQANSNLPSNFQQMQNMQSQNQLMQQLSANYPEFYNQMQDRQMDQLSRPEFFQRQQMSEMDPRFMSMEDPYRSEGRGPMEFEEPKKEPSRLYKTAKKWGYYLYVVWPLLKGWGIVG